MHCKTVVLETRQTDLAPSLNTQGLMPQTKPVCPYCDRHNIEPMPPSSLEAQSINTWYQCGDCHRVWSLPKVPPYPQPASAPDAVRVT